MSVKLDIQLVRGDSAAISQYLGSEGSLSVDTEKKQLRLHDGETVGGLPVDRGDEIIDVIVTALNAATAALS